MGRGGGWYREIAPINGRFPQSAIRRLLWFCRPVFIPLLFFRLFFFFFYCPFLKQNEKQGRLGLAGEWLSVTEPRISRDFRFRKHTWFKWYPCNLIALFVNDICYARIISPWPVVLVPFFFLFFFPGNGIGKFGISMDETFFFFFWHLFPGIWRFHFTARSIVSNHDEIFFFSFVTGKSNRAIGWQSMVNICPKKKRIKKKYCKIIVSI